MEIEACIETLNEAVYNFAHGARTLEICDELNIGGVTPKLALVKSILSTVPINCKVIVRPRGGDFVYNKEEKLHMINSIVELKSLPISGIVTGALIKNEESYELDLHFIKELCTIAYPLEITIHKCFDELTNLKKAIIDLQSIDNIKFILTSGTSNTAWNGCYNLRILQNMAGPKIKIIAAGTIVSDNRNQISDLTGISLLHGRKII